MVIDFLTMSFALFWVLHIFLFYAVLSCHCFLFLSFILKNITRFPLPSLFVYGGTIFDNLEWSTNLVSINQGTLEASQIYRCQSNMRTELQKQPLPIYGAQDGISFQSGDRDRLL